MGTAAPPQTSDPINGLAWGQAAWPQRPLCPAASPPHLGVRAAPDAKTFRSTKPARQSWGGGPDPSSSLSSPPPPESPNVLSVPPSSTERVTILSSGESRRVSLLDMVGGGGCLRRTNVCNIRKEVQTPGFEVLCCF